MGKTVEDTDVVSVVVAELVRKVDPVEVAELLADVAAVVDPDEVAEVDPVKVAVELIVVEPVGDAVDVADDMRCTNGRRL